MVNGYVNYPQELLNIDSLRGNPVINGIYDKLNKAYNSGKPFVGAFTYVGITATFSPTVFKNANDLYTSFILAGVSVSVVVSPNDAVTVVVGA